MFAQLALTVFLTLTPSSECPDGFIHQPPMCVSEVEIGEPLILEGYWGSGVERWRPWIEVYFLDVDVEHALRIMRCESGGDPNATGRAGEMSLFQHHPDYWAERSARYGWGGWSAWSVDANVAVAAAMVYHDSRSWQHWSCER